MRAPCCSDELFSSSDFGQSYGGKGRRGEGRLCGHWQPSAGAPTSGWDFDARSDLGIASKHRNVGSWDRPPGDPPGTPLYCEGVRGASSERSRGLERDKRQRGKLCGEPVHVAPLLSLLTVACAAPAISENCGALERARVEWVFAAAKSLVLRRGCSLAQRHHAPL